MHTYFIRFISTGRIILVSFDSDDQARNFAIEKHGEHWRDKIELFSAREL